MPILLGVYGAHDNVYFGRVEDGTLESEFSGNLTEVCPTGVFTDKTHSERYNRKWDMQFAGLQNIKDSNECDDFKKVQAELKNDLIAIKESLRKATLQYD